MMRTTQHMQGQDARCLAMMAPPAGFEPASTGLKDRGPVPLHEGGVESLNWSGQQESEDRGSASELCQPSAPESRRARGGDPLCCAPGPVSVSEREPTRRAPFKCYRSIGGVHCDKSQCARKDRRPVPLDECGVDL